MSIKLSVIGKSGVGKSTFSETAKKYFADKGENAKIVKLSDPLYLLQHHFYEIAYLNIQDYTNQDQILMEKIADTLRELSPSSLVNNFSEKVNSLKCDVIINDDLRDPYVDAKYFLENNFIIIRIESDEKIRLSRLKARNDISRTDKSTENLDLIPVNFSICNNGDMQEYRNKIYTLLERIVNINKKVKV